MSTPQLEHGYTRIANEILEAVARYRFNGTQLRILLVVWRYTYGFSRKDHEFTSTFLSEAIGAPRSHVEKELTALIDRNVLEVLTGGNGRPRTICFNKNYAEWGMPQKQGKEEANAGIHAEIIDYLNEKTRKRYSHRSEANKKLINGRLREGRTVEDFKQVIDIKCSHWLDDPNMCEYLRPDTLFRPSNFDKYLNQQPKAEPVRDPSLRQRDREIEFQRHLMNGGDPDAFDWST